jgi:YYY domain-containing protein
LAAQLAIWWLVLQVFGLLGVPIAAFLFQSLPDRGYALSKSLGLLLTGYGAWVLAMFGLGSFGAPLVVFVMLLLGVLGVVLLRGYWGVPLHPGALWQRVVALLRRSWRGLLAYEVLFLAALVFLAWMRAHDMGFVGPHPWGTERPMDFAFFNAIRYSSTFPPADPWLAGYSINYYYFGYLLMAVVALLSGLEPGVAYNLALASIFALTALGVAGIVSNLVLLVQRARQAREESAEATPRQRAWRMGGRYLAALLGAVLVLLAGNQAGALQLVVGDHRLVALDGPQLVSAVAQAVGNPEQSIDVPDPVPTSDFDTLATLERTNSIDDFNWWWPSRALWDTYQQPGGEVLRRYTITEFPFFSFWLGDMHPHVMALPFNVLALALALATMARASLPAFAQGRAGWLNLLLTGVVLGSLYAINSWDLPTYVLLYGGALLLLHVRLAEGQVGWKLLSQHIGMVVVALILLFLPFHLTFHSLVGFKEPLVNVPIVSRLTQIIAPFVADKSGLHAFLMIFG